MSTNSTAMSPAFTHREAKLEDLPHICTFPQNATELYFMFPKANFPLTFEQLKLNFENRSESTVFLVGSRVVAYANMYDVEPGKQCFLGNVIIDPEFRGKGVSTYLLETMSKIAVERHGARELHLSCFNTNTTGLLLYHKTGFIPYALEKRTDHLGQAILAIHMKKRLTD